MSVWKPRALRWVLVQRIIIAQSVIVILMASIGFALYSGLWLSGSILNGVYELSAIDALTGAVSRSSNGNLELMPTPDLARLRSEEPNLWFVVRDDIGHELSEGSPPFATQSVLNVPLTLTEGRFGSSPKTVGFAIVRRVQTKAGMVQMITTTHGKITWRELVEQATTVYQAALNTALFMAAAALAVTPLVARRAFHTLNRAAEEAARIDINRMGARLEVTGLPSEVLPFVNAVNAALSRLDQGYEARRRFIADAAHELRTPIAILSTRIAALPPGPSRCRLQEDSARLATLADQLIDIQRLDQTKICFTNVDLVSLSQRVIVELAPITFSAGYEIAFHADVDSVLVTGDQLAIERALSNLIQNAINYGLRRGAITVKVSPDKWLEVCDEGAGVSDSLRGQVLEAFRRPGDETPGVGLGLDLVKRIMQLHSGAATISVHKTRGACIRLQFPA